MALSTGNLTQSISVPGLSRQSTIPLAVWDSLSDTSDAASCYVYQRFSNKLQAYLVSYVSSVTSEYSVLATKSE